MFKYVFWFLLFFNGGFLTGGGGGGGGGGGATAPLAPPLATAILQVNFFVNYCFIRSHSLKPTHCRSAGRQATNTHTLNSWERHFGQSLRLTAAMLDHHVQMSVFIACEQSLVYRRKYCFLSKIR